MSAEVWWLVFWILLLALISSIAALVWYVAKDACRSTPVYNTDAEELTKIQNDYRLLPRYSCTNEVDGSFSILPDKKQEESKRFSSAAQLASSVDNLEFCDPQAIDVLSRITSVEEQAASVESEIEEFSGTLRDVRYYDLNERLLLCLIALSDMRCETTELREKRAEVSARVENAQKRLKTKARDVL